MDEMQSAIEREQSAHTIRRARTWLLVAALLTLFFGLYTPIAFGLHATVGIWSTPVLGLVLLGLWLWAARNPLPATVIALALYGGVTLVQIVLQPSLVVTGILSFAFRTFVLVSLATGVAAALRYRKLTDKAA